MKTYVFRAGWIAWSCGVFVTPVNWTKNGDEIEIQIDHRNVAPSSNNLQFIGGAMLLEKHEGRQLLLVPDEGAPVRANVLQVMMDDPVRIRVQPIPDAQAKE